MEQNQVNKILANADRQYTNMLIDILFKGTDRLIKRKKLEEYLENLTVW